MQGTTLLTACHLQGNRTGNGGNGGWGERYGLLVQNSGGCPGNGGGVNSPAVVAGCTVAGNATGSPGTPPPFYEGCGGGIYGGTISNCVLTGNYADFRGGGAADGILDNCLVVGNTAGLIGFGAAGCEMNNCTISGHAGLAVDLGGREMNNCICWDNPGGNYYRGSIRYTCTTPLPEGEGNITNDPQFVDAAASNFHLRADSPCVDAGANADMPGGPDLDGVARPLDGNNDGTAVVDMGCYEFVSDVADTDHDSIRDGWEVKQGLDPTNAADAAQNPDGDPFDNAGEFYADTNPWDGNDFFQVTDGAHTNSFSVWFDCSTARVYGLEFATGLLHGAWGTVDGLTNVPGAPSGRMSLTDTNAAERQYYRVGVGLP